jgi:anti-sigma factor RsiW
VTTDNDQLLLNAYVDGELDLAHALEFERRLAENPALAEEHQRIEALRRVLQERLPRATASPALRRRVMALAQPQPPFRTAGRRTGWAAMAASLVAAVAAGSIGTLVALGPGGREPVPELLVASHLRGLMPNHAVDVESSDSHTVKPWFNGRLPVAPRVVNLGAQGFPLVGGRIDVIGLTPVPTLVYQARKHVISVTALLLPERGSAPSRPINGYNIIEWTDGPLAYWAVSDLAAPELEAFTKAFRTGDAEP